MPDQICIDESVDSNTTKYSSSEDKEIDKASLHEVRVMIVCYWKRFSMGQKPFHFDQIISFLTNTFHFWQTHFVSDKPFFVSDKPFLNSIFIQDVLEVAFGTNDNESIYAFTVVAQYEGRPDFRTFGNCCSILEFQFHNWEILMPDQSYVLLNKVI